MNGSMILRLKDRERDDRKCIEGSSEGFEVERLRGGKEGKRKGSDDEKIREAKLKEEKVERSKGKFRGCEKNEREKTERKNKRDRGRNS